MEKQGTIHIKGIVQGVGFRPFVYRTAVSLGIRGWVSNQGSEVNICAAGERFDDFVSALRIGPPLATIDSIEVYPCTTPVSPGFEIISSKKGAYTGFIPPDIATCDECITDILDPASRYYGYFATSCLNCGPRYSIIKELPYDRERTAMDAFPPCPSCSFEYNDPGNRRHHAQTIACSTCGPELVLTDTKGSPVEVNQPIQKAAELLDAGSIIAIKGNGGFHIACTEQVSGDLKQRLGRTEQPFAVMGTESAIRSIVTVSDEEWAVLHSPASPIVILTKRHPDSYMDISNLHTIGCMLPYTGLHHLLFSCLSADILIMTSANVPGYPMITDTVTAREKLGTQVDYILTHNRDIINRCDDSVVRDGLIIRLSRGIAPIRTEVDLGKKTILGVGPELNANVSLYQGGFCITSPHVGNVRNPATFDYLKETVRMLSGLLQANPDIIAHDLHPQFLSTRYARESAEQGGIELIPVQHHRAHIAATYQGPCVGIAIDGVGYGDDKTVWGGEIFAGELPSLTRVAHLEPLPMPGGDVATEFPERMLLGILPYDSTADLLISRGWSETDVTIIRQQIEKQFNTVMTSSTGRVLDAASALLGICTRHTYDGEPAMRLEAAAYGSTPEKWELVFQNSHGCRILSTRSLIKNAWDAYQKEPNSINRIKTIAASVQYNLARGIAIMAADAADDGGYKTVALSGGVAYNQMIRNTIIDSLSSRGLTCAINRRYPLGDGCISYGQCVYAASLLRE